MTYVGLTKKDMEWIKSASSDEYYIKDGYYFKYWEDDFGKVKNVIKFNKRIVESNCSIQKMK